ncbi:MAG: Maf family protein, partial [Gammaproteobacteria bacterium]
AETMLVALSGTEHQVITGLALLCGETLTQTTVTTHLWFRKLGAEEISRYAESAESQGAAGGYAVQGGAAAFVTRLVGSYSNVVGLPLAETARLLCDAGLAR